MTRMYIHNETSASQKAVPYLEGVRQKMGKVFNFHGVLANSPAALKAFMEYSSVLENEGTLSQIEKQAIALAAAEANKSSYCLGAHTMLCTMMLGLKEEETFALRKAEANDSKLRILGQFTKAVINERGLLAESRLKELTSAGFSDEQILEIHAQIVGSIFKNYLSVLFNIEVDIPPARELK